MPAIATYCRICEAACGLIAEVRLSANGRSIEIGAAIDPALSPGAVAVPHGYGHEPGSSWQFAQQRGGQNINQLAASDAASLDPESGMAQLIGVALKVEVLAEISPDSPAIVAADPSGSPRPEAEA